MTSLSSTGFVVEKKGADYNHVLTIKASNKSQYPLALVPSVLKKIWEAKVFTKLGLRSAYNLVWIHEGTFTAFSTTLGNFKYCITLYGLSSATAVFQCLINDFLRDILGKFVVTYMTPMSNRCWPDSSSINSISNEKKCELHTARINFPVYFTAGVIMDQENVSAVIN